METFTPMTEKGGYIFIGDNTTFELGTYADIGFEWQWKAHS